jgi:hypothetical protein
MASLELQSSSGTAGTRPDPSRAPRREPAAAINAAEENDTHADLDAQSNKNGVTRKLSRALSAELSTLFCVPVMIELTLLPTEGIAYGR